jgi:hypothetical protein
MKFRFGLSFAAVAWLAQGTGKATPKVNPPSPVLSDGLAGSYLVEFEDGQAASTFFSDLRDAGFDFKERQTFDSPAFQGVSFTILNDTNSQEVGDRLGSSLRARMLIDTDPGVL